MKKFIFSPILKISGRLLGGKNREEDENYEKEAKFIHENNDFLFDPLFNQDSSDDDTVADPEWEGGIENSDISIESLENVKLELEKLNRDKILVIRRTHSLIIAFWILTAISLFTTCCWIYFVHIINSHPKTFSIAKLVSYAKYQGIYEIYFSSIVIISTISKYFFGKYSGIRSACQTFGVVYNLHFYMSFTLMTNNFVDDLDTLKDRMNRSLWNSSAFKSSLWNESQISGECCGIDNYQDWNNLIINHEHVTDMQSYKINKNNELNLNNGDEIQLKYPSSCYKNRSSAGAGSDKLTKGQNIWTKGCYSNEKYILEKYGILLLVLQLHSCIVFHLYFFLHKYIWRYGSNHKRICSTLDKLTNSNRPYEINPSLPL